MCHSPALPDPARHQAAIFRLTQAMERDMQAQRPLIETRQKGQTSEVHWTPDRCRRAREAGADFKVSVDEKAD